jgi:hypothetical protein
VVLLKLTSDAERPGKLSVERHVSGLQNKTGYRYV